MTWRILSLTLQHPVLAWCQQQRAGLLWARPFPGSLLSQSSCYSHCHFPEPCLLCSISAGISSFLLRIRRPSPHYARLILSGHFSSLLIMLVAWSLETCQLLLIFHLFGADPFPCGFLCFICLQLAYSYLFRFLNSILSSDLIKIFKKLSTFSIFPILKITCHQITHKSILL